MKYYLIAGEASGDLHGSNLMNELKKQDSDAEFRFFGGEKMQAAGGILVKHYREMAFMGFVNVLLNIRTIKRNMKICKKDISEFYPDVLILIDYPGFNLYIAEFAKRNNLKVYYYISPKIWAWKEHRVKKIRAFVDEMFTILPFETEFYKKHGVNVNYVGNPLLDSISQFRQNAADEKFFIQNNKLGDRPIVALLCGSRVQEIKKILPVMVRVSQYFKEQQFVIAGVKTIDNQLYKDLQQGAEIPVIFDQTYDLLHVARAALVASGTAVLETALFKVPQVVLYKIEGGRLMNFVMWNFVLKTKWVSLPNIILQKEAVKELLQGDMTVDNVKTELNELLNNKRHREEILKDYNRLLEIMGNPGSSERAAKKMVELLNR